jgi:transposase
MDVIIAKFVDEITTKLIARNSIGYESAVQLILTPADNGGNPPSDANFAALCSVSPVPASSGKVSWHRLNGGNSCKATRISHSSEPAA